MITARIIMTKPLPTAEGLKDNVLVYTNGTDRHVLSQIAGDERML